MEDFKIKIFEEENNLKFPSYTSLTNAECLDLKSKIIKKFNLRSDNVSEDIFLLQEHYQDCDASEKFNLLETLAKVSILPLNNVYIDWYEFEEIDIISTSNFSKYFYDIWYPVADDINIFDESLNWFVYIRHDGAIYFYNKEYWA